MIRQVYQIDDWAIEFLISVNSNDIEKVEKSLKRIDCPESLVKKARNMILSGEKNTGFAYSNFNLEETVITIGEASSMGEILNTLVHECYHLMDHLKMVRGYDDEELATMFGDFLQLIFDNIIDIFNKI